METKFKALQAGPVFQKEGRAIFWTDESKPGKWQRRLDDGGVFPQHYAKLFAAAPDLLDALRDCVFAFSQIPPLGQPKNSVIGAADTAAKAAIAKATA